MGVSTYSTTAVMGGYKVIPARRHWEQTKPRRPWGYMFASNISFADALLFAPTITLVPVLPIFVPFIVTRAKFLLDALLVTSILVTEPTWTA